MPGYIIVDCNGLDISSGSAQTIDDIYETVTKALATGHEIIFENCVYGSYAVSPIAVYGYTTGTAITLYFGSKTVAITDADSVTIS